MSDWDAIAIAARAPLARFEQALSEPREAQAALLARIIAENAGTEFGARHSFSRLRSASDYCAAVPIETHADRAPDIDRIAAGETNVRTSAPIIAFEETGGSTAGAKLVPYTAPALAAFRSAVLPWFADLVTTRPAIRSGRAYFAISPATRRPRATACGIPVGLPSDAAYLGEDVGEHLEALTAVPFAVAAIADMQAWRRATLGALLAAADLSFVSVWSPTYFTLLIDAAPALWPQIADAVSAAAGSARASVIERALGAEPVDWAAVWPHLDTVSTWTHATSAPFARDLARRLPHAVLQGKGLLATEGVVTIPFGRAMYPLPALDSTFIELVECDARSAATRLVTQAEPGGTYRVLMTTPGGFYRYDIGDRVLCRGFHDNVPMFEFAGRSGAGSDLVGEKLAESFAANCLPQLPFCALLAASSPHPHYVLLLDPRHVGQCETGAALALALDRALRANPQYSYARALGQLGPVRPLALFGAHDRLISAQLASGRRLGDIKPQTLIADTRVLAALEAPPTDTAACTSD